MNRYGNLLDQNPAVFTDSNLQTAGTKAGRDGMETAVANLTYTLLSVKGETSSAEEFLKMHPAKISRPAFLLRPGSAIAAAFRAAGLTGLSPSSFRKAEIQVLRTYIEKGEPLLFRLRHDATAGTRYVVCWGAECATGGEAGDRWKFFISDGRTDKLSEIVLWDLKDASFMSLT